MSKLAEHQTFNLVYDPNNSFTVHPINNRTIWNMYKKELACFWTVEEVDLSKDKNDWDNILNENEKQFIKNTLGFFAGSDGIVNHNLQSIGNIITISDATKKYSGQVVRLALLSAHYSQPLDWNDELLNNQKNTIDKWYNCFDEVSNENVLDISETLLDDLNTPGFIAKIHELFKNAKNGDKKSRNQFNNACRLLGLFDLSKTEWNEFKKNNTEIDEDFILKKINERTKAKNVGNFVLADTIRNELFKKGVVIEDQKGKTNWKYK